MKYHVNYQRRQQSPFSVCTTSVDDIITMDLDLSPDVTKAIQEATDKTPAGYEIVGIIPAS